MTRKPSGKTESAARTEHVSAETLERALEVALLVESNLSQEDIARRLRKPRSVISALWRIALEKQIYVAAVLPLEADSDIKALEKEVEDKLGLKYVRLVRGRDLSKPLPAVARETIYRLATQKAAEFVDATLTNEDIVCVAWGKTILQVVRYIKPSKPLPNLTVCPLLGVLHRNPTDEEANAIVESLAELYGATTYHCLPVPAIVRDQAQKQVAESLPIVSEALADIKRSNYLITSIASPDPEKSTVAVKGLLGGDEIDDLIKRGARGEICAYFFDRLGREVPSINLPIGLGYHGIVDTAERGISVAIVAADIGRLDATYAAIQGRLINSLVSDTGFARQLLKRHEERRSDEGFNSR